MTLQVSNRTVVIEMLAALAEVIIKVKDGTFRQVLMCNISRGRLPLDPLALHHRCTQCVRMLET